MKLAYMMLQSERPITIRTDTISNQSYLLLSEWGSPGLDQIAIRIQADTVSAYRRAAKAFRDEFDLAQLASGSESSMDIPK